MTIQQPIAENIVQTQGLEKQPKNKSKILIHAINFYPEFIGCGKYTGELAFFLAEMGHDVEVVTAPPHYPGWFVEAPYKALRYQRESIKGVDVLRCPMLMKRNGGGKWRAIAPLTFAAFAAPAVIWRILATRPDVVLCVEPTIMSTPAALFAAKIVGARTLLHVQDLEVDAAFEVGHLRGHALRKFAATVERFLLRAFDLTVTISNKMRAALISKGAEPEKTAVIRNWVNLDTIHPRPADEPNLFRDELGLREDTFVVLYSGSMGKKQALHVVLEAAALCQRHNRIHFVMAGEGPAKADLVEKYGNMTNVTFLPLQPLERFTHLLSLANLHVLPQGGNAADLVLPSKLGGMLASGRPVVATVRPNTELGEMLTGSALVIEPENSTALAEAICAAAEQDLSELSERGRKLATQLSSKHLLPAFERALVEQNPNTASAQSPNILAKGTKA